MICPKCSTEIKEGFMYCPKCGEEIKIVPEYEASVEVGIEAAISEVAGIIADTVEEVKAEENQSETNLQNQTVHNNDADGDDDLKLFDFSDNNKFKNKTISWPKRILIGVCLVALIAIIVGMYRVVTIINNYYSYEYQYSKAEQEFLDADYDNVVKTTKHIMTIDSQAEKPRLLLADSYYALDKYDESIAVLTALLSDFPEDASVYERLLANYEAQGDITSIISLSEQCTDEGIGAMFRDYVSEAPEYNLEDGTYFAPQVVRIIGKGNGTIYYTDDGTEPSLSSNEYTVPINVSKGTATIAAVYENEKGVVSPVSSVTINIEILKPDKPKLLTESGDYTSPRLIKVEEPAEGNIYYTTDGTNPTVKSKQYKAPLAMPLGKSEFRFILIDDSGIAGEVASAEYNLVVNSAIDTETAKNAVIFMLTAQGKDIASHEFAAKYAYSESGRTYYFIEEYSGGNKGKVLNTYGVDTESGNLFVVTRNGDTKDYDFAPL